MEYKKNENGNYIKKFKSNGCKYKVIIKIDKTIEGGFFERGSLINPRLQDVKHTAKVTIFKNGNKVANYNRRELTKENFNTIQKLVFRKGVSKKELIEDIIDNAKKNY